MPLYQGFKQDAQSQLTPVIPLLLDEATGNEVALDLSHTVNKATSGNNTGTLMNVTDTASPGTSLFVDYQVGGSTQFSIDFSGNVVVGGTVDGRDLATDGTKLDGIATGATVGAFAADGQTQITPNTSITLDEATGNEIALDLSYTTNKATSGDDTGLKLNKTDTASPGTSLLLDLQVGGASQVTIDDVGQLWLDIGDTFGSTTGIYFGSNKTQGIYQNAEGQLKIVSNSVDAFKFQNAIFRGIEAEGPFFLNEVPSTTNPTICPRSDLGTGLGSNANNELSIICNSVEMARFNQGESNAFLHLYNDHATGGTNYERLEITGQTGGNFLMQVGVGGTGDATRAIEIDSKVILDPSETYGTGTGLWFGSTADTGIFEESADVMQFRIGDARTWYMSGQYLYANSNGATLRNILASSTVPTLIPYRSSATTGIGANAAGEISLISQATEVGRLSIGDSNNHLYLYNDSGATNWERLEIKGQTAGNFLIQTAAGGTGDVVDIEIDSKVILDSSNTYGTGTGLRFGSTADTGFYEVSDNVLAVLVANSTQYRFTTGQFRSNTAGGPLMRNVAASATVPGLNPNQADTSTGIGANAAGEISLITAGVEKVRTSATAALHLNTGDGTSTNDGIWFGSTADTGFYEGAADVLRTRLGGTDRWIWTVNNIQAVTTGGPQITNIASSATAPTLKPNSSSGNTGIGANAAGEISLISQATEVGRLSIGDSNNHLYLYNDSGSTNWERLEIKGQTAGNFLLTTTVGGTGTKRNIAIDSKVVLDPNAGYGTGTGLWFSDGNTGLYEASANQLRFQHNGTDMCVLDGNGVKSAVSDGFRLINQSPSATLPTIVPKRDASTTGIGSDASNRISLICSATEIARVTSTQLALQPSTELQLDMTTESSPFINFKATADGDATSAISTLTTSGATTHHVQVSLNGTTAWIAVSTTDPS